MLWCKQKVIFIWILNTLYDLLYIKMYIAVLYWYRDRLREWGIFFLKNPFNATTQSQTLHFAYVNEKQGWVSLPLLDNTMQTVL